MRYTKRAAEQLSGILSFIHAHSPSGARAVGLRLKTTIDLIAEFPAAGQRTDTSNVRRALALPYPYAVFYRVGVDAVVILAVRHTAQRGKI